MAGIQLVLIALVEGTQAQSVTDAVNEFSASLNLGRWILAQIFQVQRAYSISAENLRK
jgi:hypothetical protein